MGQDALDDQLVSPGVVLQKRDHIATLIINGPKDLNDLDWDTIVDIIIAVENARDDKDIYALIIPGVRDRGFAAERDIAMQSLTSLGKSR